MIIKLIVFQPIKFVIIMYTINLLKYTYFQWVGLKVTYPTVLKYQAEREYCGKLLHPFE